MFTEYSFMKRLVIFLAIDVAIAEVYSFVPSDLWAVRVPLAVAQIGFMAATLGIAVVRTLQDY